MTNYEFSALDINKRADYVWEKGIYLAGSKDNTSGLYFVERFFVEIIFDENTSKITEVTPFLRGERLDKYLDQVNFKF